MNNPKVSICIPTWEQNNNGVNFLTDLLNSIQIQTYKDFEVVISDHSIDNKIFDFIHTSNYEFDINYIRNEKMRGNGPHNTNNAIRHSKGEIIKTIFQDDFFFSEHSLRKIVEPFEDKLVKWLVTGCNHTNYNKTNYWGEMIPKWNDNIYKGVNTISSPSVLSFRKDSEIFFDEELTMLMDCEMYYNFFTTYGLPFVIDDTLITNRIHENQISQNYDKNLNDEINYVIKKYNL